MGSILEPFSNIIAPGSLQVPNGRLSIDWSNSLSRNLQGAYLPGVSRGINIAGRGADMVFGSAPQSTQVNITADGVGLKNSVANDLLSATATTAMTTNTDIWTLFWRGAPTANNPAVDGTILFGINYDAAGGSPYDGYEFYRFQTGIYIQMNNSAGQVSDPTPIVDVSTYGANKMMSLGAIINPQAKTSTTYLNGKLISGPLGWAGNPTTFGTNPKLSIGSYYPFARATNAITNAAYLWNRGLSTAEHAFIAANPYSILTSNEYEMPIMSSGISFISGWSRQSNLPVIGGGTF